MVRAVFMISSGVVRVLVHVVVDDMPDLGDLNCKRSNGGSRPMVCAVVEEGGRCCCCCRRLSASVYGVCGGFCCRVFSFNSMGCIKIFISNSCIKLFILMGCIKSSILIGCNK